LIDIVYRDMLCDWNVTVGLAESYIGFVFLIPILSVDNMSYCVCRPSLMKTYLVKFTAKCTWLILLEGNSYLNV